MLCNAQQLIIIDAICLISLMETKKIHYQLRSNLNNTIIIFRIGKELEALRFKNAIRKKLLLHCVFF